jgi:hypothetical protein
MRVIPFLITLIFVGMNLGLNARMIKIGIIFVSVFAPKNTGKLAKNKRKKLVYRFKNEEFYF